jgi:outer membrane assembly lipoprotein YfiO
VKEIPINGKPTIEGSEKDLFTSAKKVYAKNYLLVAQDSFRSILENYPLGPYAEFASIKLADTKFIQLDFDEAAKLYEEAIQNYPLSESTPYSRMRAGRSFQLMNTDLGRDREPIERAVQHYQEFLKKHPQSMFRPQVEAYLEEAYLALAQHEKLVAEFYERRGHKKAARKRDASYQIALARFGMNSTSSIDETAKASLSVDTTTSLSVDTTTSSDETEATATKELGAPQEAASPTDSTQVNAPIREKSNAQKHVASASLRDVACSVRGGKKVTIQLASAPVAPFSTQLLSPDSETITTNLPALLSERLSLTCFQEDDLSISEDGTLSLETSAPFLAFQLNNPPRIVLVEKTNSQ